jgi:hypothetical protein
MMPEVAQARGTSSSGEPVSPGASASAPVAVEQPAAAEVVPSTSQPGYVSLREAAYDVPVALLQVVSVAARRYGAELFALSVTVLICRYLLGMPAVALGIGAGVGTSALRLLLSRLRA